MAKWFGKVGYSNGTVESRPGVWEEQIVERNYYGDVIRINRNLQNANQVVDSIDISNEFSIVADPFAYENFHAMRYVEFMGARWKITKVDASQRPRLILSVGGLYNGK